jgi:hypothetical protein
MNDDLRVAKAKLASARQTWRILGDKLRSIHEAVRSRRLFDDEVIQLRYAYRSTSIARDRAWADVKGWRRIVDRLEGRPEPQGSVALARKRMAKPGYLTSTTGRSS